MVHYNITGARHLVVIHDNQFRTVPATLQVIRVLCINTRDKRIKLWASPAASRSIANGEEHGIFV